MESLKDTEILNTLESSVYQQYIDVQIEAGLCAFSIKYYHICNPLLCRAKTDKRPLEMNGRIVKLGEFEDKLKAFVSLTVSLWPSASPKDESFNQDITWMLCS